VLNGAHIDLAAVPSLDDLSARPDRVHGLSSEVLAALMAKAAAVQNLLAAEALAAVTIKPRKRTEREQAIEGPDRILDVDEAAKRIGATRRWLFRNAATLPFVKRVSRKQLACSERGLDRWLAAREAVHLDTIAIPQYHRSHAK